MSILGNGKVGVGTTNPSKLFSVNAPSGAWEIAEIRSPNTASLLEFYSNGTINKGVQIGSMANDFIVRTNGGFERMRVDGNGNVGVGTTSPTEKLEVSGNVKLSGDISSSSSAMKITSGGSICLGKCQ